VDSQRYGDVFLSHIIALLPALLRVFLCQIASYIGRCRWGVIRAKLCATKGFHFVFVHGCDHDTIKEEQSS
jgi:hypothetical protein